jgi:hypothetical protein
MSDRLALANAIEDTGVDRAKAERVASIIFDAIRENVATKADVQAARTDLHGEIATTRADLRGEIEAVRSELHLVEHRLVTRLGGLAVVLSGLLFAALHYWPPHG